MKPQVFIATVISAWLAIAGPATATIVVSADLGELVAGAHIIAHGHVVGVYPVRLDGRHTETLVTLAPIACLKGEPAGDLVFRVPGGEIGRYRTVVVGAPVFREGDEVVVFLAGQAPRIPHIVGFSQGVLRVVRDQDSARPMVLAPPSAGDSQEAAAERIVRGDGTRRMLSLREFSSQVQALIERGPRIPPAEPPAGGAVKIPRRGL